ncbi:RNAse P Rpr2/Rpp21 subunit domain-containing protein [Cryptosporidium muris RN66]|uniref:RNAse P Rpr2/Rpp21 subunit domain-containing protein n=1 Tax=Cryptosporidium muris (strain RN66) TaxID=441375 RepID=B6ABF6_CRYMR|nr:RNAse P Rpr2/Rpp21 subunit domain-containing protein [Cryptosporidium muris RN66]EEA05708.1 RNAse P Rpr2/Rpp21 subunit domain-containing protein [Cryptosporidium muris RN66]|eukprot:XP_002140057.1 RNAse P Rpr2/Rpp21 subunit domain-containing protein [Cryptosporidium muris RN66]
MSHEIHEVIKSQSPVYHRLNYLLYIGQIYSIISPELARQCFRNAREISRKKVARISSKSRHWWCLKCNSHLIPGISCDVKHEERKKRRNINSQHSCKEDYKFNKLDQLEDPNNQFIKYEWIVNLAIRCYYCNKIKRHSFVSCDYPTN